MPAQISSANRPAWVLLAVALLIMIVATVHGALRYSSLPERFAVHWNGAGAANGFADKSIASAFSAVFIGYGILALFTLISMIMPRIRRAPNPATDFALAATQTFLGVTAIGLSLVFWLVSMQIWAGTGNTFNGLLIVLLVLLTLVIAVIFANRRHKAEWLKHPQPDNADGKGSESYDDERFWIAGLIYNNPTDTKVFVPKRSGLGTTVNWAQPGGKAILLGICAIPVVVIGLSMWASTTH